MALKPLGLVLLGMATASTGAACPSQQRTPAGVIATEKAWVDALEHRSPAALDCILDASFLDDDWRGGQVSRAEVFARLPKRPPSTLHLSDLTVTVEGAMAVVRGLNQQTGPDGKLVGTVRFTDIFVYRDHRWRALAAQETLVRPTD